MCSASGRPRSGCDPVDAQAIRGPAGGPTRPFTRGLRAAWGSRCLTGLPWVSGAMASFDGVVRWHRAMLSCDGVVRVLKPLAGRGLRVRTDLDLIAAPEPGELAPALRGLPLGVARVHSAPSGAPARSAPTSDPRCACTRIAPRCAWPYRAVPRRVRDLSRSRTSQGRRASSPRRPRPIPECKVQGPHASQLLGDSCIRDGWLACRNQWRMASKASALDLRFLVMGLICRPSRTLIDS